MQCRLQSNLSHLTLITLDNAFQIEPILYLNEAWEKRHQTNGIWWAISILIPCFPPIVWHSRESNQRPPAHGANVPPLSHCCVAVVCNVCCFVSCIWNSWSVWAGRLGTCKYAINKTITFIFNNHLHKHFKMAWCFYQATFVSFCFDVCALRDSVQMLALMCFSVRSLHRWAT